VGNTVIGENVKVFPFAVIGQEPQHFKYKNEPTLTEVGNHCTIREFVTIHRGTELGGGITKIGESTYLMAYSHVAHDCLIGSHVIICNTAQIAGHVVIEDHATIGGLVGVVQFCRVGKFAYVGGSSTIRKDLPPFLVGKGHEFEIQGVNVVGLSRKGFNSDTIKDLKKVYKLFYLQGHVASVAIEKAALEFPENSEVRHFIDFVKNSKVGVIR
jgi:UDP-N-acetylglucosamine acyltransferase